MTPDNRINTEEQQAGVVRTKLTKFDENYIEKLQKGLEIKGISEFKVSLKRYDAEFTGDDLYTRKGNIPKEIISTLFPYRIGLWAMPLS